MSDDRLHRLDILGPTLVDGEPVTGTEGALLAVLGLSPNQALTRTLLAGVLWPDASAEQARSRLKTYVWRVRRSGHLEALNASIETARDTYALKIDSAMLDVTRFRRLVTEADEAMVRGGWELSRTRLDEALALWRGRLLAEVDNPAFWIPQARELDDEREAAIDLRLEVDLRLGHTRDAMARLHELARAQPTRVRRWHLLIEALRSNGRSVEALAVAREAREGLQEHGLTDALELIGQLEGAVLRHEGPDEITVLTTRRTVAARPDGLVGRDEELAVLDAEWQRARHGVTSAVLISGPAGSGASHLIRSFVHQSHFPAIEVEPDGSLATQPTNPVVVVVDGDAAHAPERHRSLPDLVRRLPDGCLVLVAATSPRTGHGLLVRDLERELGRLTTLRIEPFDGSLLTELVARLELSPRDRTYVHRACGGLPGLAVELAKDPTGTTTLLEDRLIRWTGDISEADARTLSRFLAAGSIQVSRVLTGSDDLAAVDVIDRAIEARLLTAGADSSPGTWKLATPLLLPYLRTDEPPAHALSHHRGSSGSVGLAH